MQRHSGVALVRLIRSSCGPAPAVVWRQEPHAKNNVIFASRGSQHARALRRERRWLSKMAVMKELLDDLRTQNPQFSDALLKPLLTYLLKAREVAGGDLELNIILLVIAQRAIEHPDFPKLSMEDRLENVAAFPSRGVNARSISDSSGIPRETARRKVTELIQKRWVKREGTNLHFTSTAFRELAEIREAREQLALEIYEIISAEASRLRSTRP